MSLPIVTCSWMVGGMGVQFLNWQAKLSFRLLHAIHYLIGLYTVNYITLLYTLYSIQYQYWMVCLGQVVLEIQLHILSMQITTLTTPTTSLSTILIILTILMLILSILTSLLVIYIGHYCTGVQLSTCYTPYTLYPHGPLVMLITWSLVSYWLAADWIRLIRFRAKSWQSYSVKNG